VQSLFVEVVVAVEGRGTQTTGSSWTYTFSHSFTPTHARTHPTKLLPAVALRCGTAFRPLWNTKTRRATGGDFTVGSREALRKQQQKEVTKNKQNNEGKKSNAKQCVVQ
jgi:hypothetical protein